MNPIIESFLINALVLGIGITLSIGILSKVYHLAKQMRKEMHDVIYDNEEKSDENIRDDLSDV